jgi:nitrite reductase/ring-hydroxylating ferredoxin subunit
MSDVVAKVSEIPEGGSAVVLHDGVDIALFKVEGKIYAMHNTCPHRGASLGEGYLNGRILTCPWHAWEFDVTNGDCQTVPQNRLPCYPLRIDGDDIRFK